MLVDVFIECVAWSYWWTWTWCVCQLFATESTSASLYSILKYQIKFPLPHPGS